MLHPVRGTTFSASAVAKFVGGDVTIKLRRAGKSFVAIGKIPVPAGEAGLIAIEVTITYGGVIEPVITRMSRIRTP